jgi:hypothetical protein
MLRVFAPAFDGRYHLLFTIYRKELRVFAPAFDERYHLLFNYLQFTSHQLPRSGSGIVERNNKQSPNYRVAVKQLAQ